MFFDFMENCMAKSLRIFSSIMTVGPGHKMTLCMAPFVTHTELWHCNNGICCGSDSNTKYRQKLLPRKTTHYHASTSNVWREEMTITHQLFL